MGGLRAGTQPVTQFGIGAALNAHRCFPMPVTTWSTLRCFG